MLLQIKNLKMYYKLRKGYVRAVDDVSLDVKEGETIGIVGESGCGKTSIARSIMRLLPRNAQVMAGNIYVDGKDVLAMSDEELADIRGRKISLIFQGALNALNPVMKVADQIVEAILAHEDISKGEAQERVESLYDSVGLPLSTMYKYPHELSGGMKQRVLIAMSLSCDPKLMIADELTTALDVIVQDQVLSKIRDLQEKLNLAIIVITHDITIIAEICTKTFVMYGGKIVEHGDTVDIFSSSAHPYTYGLLSSVPSIRGPLNVLEALPGNPPDLLHPPQYCRFLPRCSYVIDVCRVRDPDQIEVRKGQWALCHRAGTFRGGS